MVYDLSKILKAKRLRESGYTIHQIANILEVSERSVFRWLRSEKLNKLINERKKVFEIKEANPYLGIEEISRNFNISRDKAFRILKDYGLCGFDKTRFQVLYTEYVYTKTSEKFLEMRLFELVGTVVDIRMINRYRYDELPPHLKLNKVVLELSEKLNYFETINKIEEIIPQLISHSLNYSLLRAYVVLGSCALWLGDKNLMKESYENLIRIRHRDMCIKFYTLLLGSLVLEGKVGFKLLKEAYKIIKILNFPKLLTGDFISVSSTKGYYYIPIPDFENYAYPSTSLIISLNKNDYKKSKKFINSIEATPDRCLAMGYFFFMKGYLDKAIRELLKSYNYDYLKIQSGILLVICYIGVGMREKAIEIYNEIKDRIITDRAKEILEFCIFLNSESEFSADVMILKAVKSGHYKKALRISKKFSNTFALRIAYILFKSYKLKDNLGEFFKNYHKESHLRYKFKENYLIFKLYKNSVKLKLSSSELNVVQKLFENGYIDGYTLSRISNSKISSIYKLVYKINKTVGFRLVYFHRGGLMLLKA